MINKSDYSTYLSRLVLRVLGMGIVVFICLLMARSTAYAFENDEVIDIVGFNYGRLQLVVDMEKTPGVNFAELRAMERLIRKKLLWSGIFDIHETAENVDLKLKIRFVPAKRVHIWIFSSENSLLFDSKQSISGKEEREEAVIRIIEEIILRLTGERSILRSAIVYVEKDKAKRYRLIMTDSFGENRRVILENSGYIILPRWNPAATAILYTSLGRGGSKIRKLSLASGKSVTLFEDMGRLSGGTWGKDGKKLIITLSRNGNSDLYKINVNGSIEERMTYRSSLESNPRWSPDGKRLLFVSNRSGSVQIYQKDLETGEIFRMTFEGSYNVEPNWSNDGAYIVFSGRKDGVNQVFLMDSDGEFIQQITYAKTPAEQPYWAPNGRQILFISKVGYDFKLFIIRADGTFKRRLTQSTVGVNEFNPTWTARYKWKFGR